MSCIGEDSMCKCVGLGISCLGSVVEDVVEFWVSVDYVVVEEGCDGFVMFFEERSGGFDDGGLGGCEGGVGRNGGCFVFIWFGGF